MNTHREPKSPMHHKSATSTPLCHVPSRDQTANLTSRNDAETKSFVMSSNVDAWTNSFVIISNVFTAQPNRPPTNQPDKYTTRNIQAHYFTRTCRFMTDVTFCSDNIQNYIFCSGNNIMTWGKLPVSSPEIVSLYPIPF